MTIYEKLFGTPERAARAIEEMTLDRIDTCKLMDALGEDIRVTCRNCLYEYDHYGCERRDVSVLEWLRQEVEA